MDDGSAPRRRKRTHQSRDKVQMRQFRRAEADRYYVCCWPGCRKLTWREKRLEVCEEHAERVLKAQRQQAQQWVQSVIDAEAQTTIAKLLGRIRQLEAQAAAKPRRSTGVVYYLRCGMHLKIGWTSDLDKRMRSYPPDSLLLAVEPGTKKLERQRHRMFAVHLVNGREWFAMTAPLLHHISMVTAKHGAPPSVTFAGKPVVVPMPHRSSSPISLAHLERTMGRLPT